MPEATARALAGRKILAFAGIGRPDKFFATLDSLGAQRTATRAFADHHPYSDTEIVQLLSDAERDGAIAVTTTKDHVRVPASLRDRVTTVKVELVFEDSGAIENLLRAAVAPAAMVAHG